MHTPCIRRLILIPVQNTPNLVNYMARLGQLTVQGRRGAHTRNPQTPNPIKAGEVPAPETLTPYTLQVQARVQGHPHTLTPSHPNTLTPSHPYTLTTPNPNPPIPNLYILMRNAEPLTTHPVYVMPLL